MITPKRLFAAIASGLGMILISPPISMFWLLWVLWVPLLWAMRDGDRRGNTLLAYLAGYAGVSTVFFWISEAIVVYSNVPGPLCLVAVHLFAMFYAIPYAFVFGRVHDLRRRFGIWWILALPAFQVAMEFLPLALSPLIGIRISLFPYFLGATQYRIPELIQIASITGVVGVTFVAILPNAVIAELVYRRREGRSLDLRPLIATIAMFLGLFAWGSHRISSINQTIEEWPEVRLSQIQQNISMQERMSSSSREVLRDWKALDDTLLDEEMDLIIWPEGSILFDPRRSRRVAQFLGQEVVNHNASLLLGGGYVEDIDDDNYELRNSAYLFTPTISTRRNGTEVPSAEIAQRYDKMVPLPFGEYIPFSETFPILREWLEGPGNFKPGDQATLFEVEAASGPFTLYTSICYEAILPRFMRREMSDSDLIVNITNDGWFGDTPAPHQHAMLTIFRAVELGTPLYRLGYTGVSFTVTPSGVISNETEPFVEGATVVTVNVGEIDTFYKSRGDIFGWLCSVLLFGGMFLTRKRVSHQAQ